MEVWIWLRAATKNPDGPKDMSDFAAMNEVYGKYFAVAAPARTIVQVAGLPKDALVEIELVAVL